MIIETDIPSWVWGLTVILAIAGTLFVRFTIHAKNRMDEHGISEHDADQVTHKQIKYATDMKEGEQRKFMQPGINNTFVAERRGNTAKVVTVYKDRTKNKDGSPKGDGEGRTWSSRS